MKVNEILKGRWEVVKQVITPSPGEWDSFAALTPIVFNHPLKKGSYIMYYMGQSLRERNWGIGYAEPYEDSEKDYALFNWQKKGQLIKYNDDRIHQIDAPYLIEIDGTYHLFCEERSFPRTFIYSIKDFIKMFIPFWLRKIMWRNERIDRQIKKTKKYIEHSKDREIVAFKSDTPYNFDIQTREVSKSEIDLCSPKIYNFNNHYHLLAGAFDKRTKTILSPIENPSYERSFPYSTNIRFCDKSSHIILDSSEKEEDWDMNGVIMCCVIKLEDGYIGTYEARDKDEVYRIGLAYSYNLTDWERFKGNPILDIGEKGRFNDRMIAAPYLFQTKKELLLFFTAYDWEMNNSIAVARFVK